MNSSSNDSHPLELAVTDIKLLTPKICLYRLASLSGQALPLITAGAHIAISVIINGKSESRSYSICSNPLVREYYEIAVQYSENETSGSSYIRNQIKVGSVIHCTLPTNHFHLHADASPSVLIAGGIGITPIISIAAVLNARGRRFSLHYAGKGQSSMAFCDELKMSFGVQTFFYFGDQEQRMSIINLLSEAPSNTLFYACGPQKMLGEIVAIGRMLGISQERIQLENFAVNKREADKPVTLELAISNKVIQASADESLLKALQRAGVPVQFDCCVGECGTCAVQFIEGGADHRDHILSDDSKSKGMICLCVSRAVGDKLTLLL